MSSRAKCRDISQNRVLEGMLESKYFPEIIGLAVTNFLDMLETEGIPREDYRNRVAGVCQFMFTLGWDEGYMEGKDDHYDEEELCPDCSAAKN